MTQFSIFDYLYRDASNYKSWGSLLLEGRATEADSNDFAHSSIATSFSSPSRLAYRRSTPNYGSLVMAPPRMTTSGIPSTNYVRQRRKK